MDTTKRDLDYEKNNVGYDYQYTKEEGGGIKCKNYETCESILPHWWHECMGHYLCPNCQVMMFGFGASSFTAQNGKGILERKDNIECPICLECKRGTTQPQCNHFICIDCFKRCHYQWKDCSGQPPFPYPADIEDEYDEDRNNPKWESDYPLIGNYHRDFERWDKLHNEKYDRESYLRMCPLCRK